MKHPFIIAIALTSFITFTCAGKPFLVTKIQADQEEDSNEQPIDEYSVTISGWCVPENDSAYAATKAKYDEAMGNASLEASHPISLARKGKVAFCPQWFVNFTYINSQETMTLEYEDITEAQFQKLGDVTVALRIGDSEDTFLEFKADIANDNIFILIEEVEKLTLDQSVKLEIENDEPMFVYKLNKKNHGARLLIV